MRAAEPTPISVPIAVTSAVSGKVSASPEMASGPTPCPMKIRSTMLYSDIMTIPMIDGIEYSSSNRPTRSACPNRAVAPSNCFAILRSFNVRSRTRPTEESHRPIRRLQRYRKSEKNRDGRRKNSQPFVLLRRPRYGYGPDLAVDKRRNETEISQAARNRLSVAPNRQNYERENQRIHSRSGGRCHLRHEPAVRPSAVRKRNGHGFRPAVQIPVRASAAGRHAQGQRPRLQAAAPGDPAADRAGPAGRRFLPDPVPELSLHGCRHRIDLAVRLSDPRGADHGGRFQGESDAANRIVHLTGALSGIGLLYRNGDGSTCRT